MGHLNEEVETMKKEPTRNCRIKYSNRNLKTHHMGSRADLSWQKKKKRICELEHSQLRLSILRNRKKNMKNHVHSLKRCLWKYYQEYQHRHNKGSQKRKKESEKIPQETVTENFTNLMKNINLHFQEAQQTPSRTNLIHS